MQCPRDPGLSNKLYLTAQRILGLVEFAVFRLSPWDEGVGDGPGILPVNWRGSCREMTEAVLVNEGYFKLSEPEPFHSLPGCYH